MAYDIIFTCKSINNKNVRDGELKILRKSTNENLCFEFGENEMNIKKRYYDNERDFEDDFTKLSMIKEADEKEVNNKEIKEKEEEEKESEIPKQKKKYDF